MPSNHHSIAYKRNVSCTMIFIARDDNRSRLVWLVSKLGLVVRVSFKVLRVVLIIILTG